MRQDFFEFTPQFKIVISGNHKPNLRTVDAPASCSFAVTIPEGQRDPHLREKLKIEAPQILSLLIKRSLEWQRLGGLTSPAKVREATESYLEEQDSFASWIEEKVRDQRKISFVPCRAVPIVEDICRSCGRVPGSMKDFVSKLAARDRSHEKRSIVGIRVRETNAGKRDWN
jgi:putative DNA primase/helicase